MAALDLEKTLKNLKVRQRLYDSIIVNGRRKFVKSANLIELLTIIALAEGTAFNAEESAMYDDTTANVGRGELSIRKKLNLSLNCPGTGFHIDIPEVNREVKEVCSGGAIKPGDAAATYWANAKDRMIYDDCDGYVAIDQPEPKRWLLNEIPQDKLANLTSLHGKSPNNWCEAINIGVSKSLLSTLPPSVNSYIKNLLIPSKFLFYPGIYYVWKDGFIDIPKDEYDAAWQPVGVSQQKPRVKLKRAYVEDRARSAYQSLITNGTIKMKSIGLIAASCKPFHNGHWDLINKASKENDEVKLYISLADRARPGELLIKGSTMEKCWRDYIAPRLPKNVSVEYVKNNSTPVRKVYEFLGLENEAGSDDTYKIYGLPDSIENYPFDSLLKYADSLTKRGLIHLEPVTPSFNISGTEMRKFILLGDKESFVNNLTHTIFDVDAIWKTIVDDGITIVPKKRVSSRKKT